MINSYRIDFSDLIRRAAERTEPANAPETITVNGVEYVRKEPAPKEPTLKYKVGDEVMVKAKIVKVDQNDAILPYKVGIGFGVDGWVTKKSVEHD